jgi:hypothetical protein
MATHSVDQTYHYSWGSSIVEQDQSWSYFMTDSQSVCLGIEHSRGTCDQILLPVGMLLSEICGLVSVGRPLWQEDWSAFCSVITQWSESRRTRNHTLLSHLRLPQPGGPGFCNIPPGTGWPSYTPGHWVGPRPQFKFALYPLISYKGLPA